MEKRKPHLNVFRSLPFTHSLQTLWVEEWKLCAIIKTRTVFSSPRSLSWNAMNLEAESTQKTLWDFVIFLFFPLRRGWTNLQSSSENLTFRLQSQWGSSFLTTVKYFRFELLNVGEKSVLSSLYTWKMLKNLVIFTQEFLTTS